MEPALNFDNFPATTRSFERRFSSEAQCEAYLFSQKYPDGFVCSRCGSVAAPLGILSRHCLLECRDCGAQSSLTTGTIFENTKKLLCDWFRALFEVAVHKTGVSAAHISRVLGVAENTGLNWLRKLRCVTVNPEREPLCGEVEADTIFFNVQDENGKGIEVPVAVAIEVERNTDKWGREHVMPGRARMGVLENQGAEEMGRFLKGTVAKGQADHRRRHGVHRRGCGPREARAGSNGQRVGARALTDGAAKPVRGQLQDVDEGHVPPVHAPAPVAALLERALLPAQQEEEQVAPEAAAKPTGTGLPTPSPDVEPIQQC